MAETPGKHLLDRIAELEERLEDAESTLHAIRNGEVDALLVSGDRGDRIFTLEGADHPYRILVQEMHEGTVTLDATGLILYSNAQFGSMLGTPLERVIGFRFQSFVAPDDIEIFSALLAAGSRQSNRSELTLIAGDGTRVPAYLSLNSLEAGHSAATCVVITDLTEQRRNQAILESEQLSRSILEQATEAVLVFDTAGRILRASDAAAQLAGANILFQKFETVFPLCTMPEAEEGAVDSNFLLAGAKSGETIRGLEVTFRPQDARKLTFLLSAGPIWNSARELIGCVVTLTDITERRNAEERLRQGQRLESLGVLAGGIAHDFNNLLTGILGNCSLVLDDLSQFDPHRNLLDEAIRAGERAAELTQQLLAYAGKGILSMAPADLSRQVREITPLLKISNRVRLDLQLDDRLPALKGDPGQLNQIVMNLVLNGVEAIGENSGRVIVKTGMAHFGEDELNGFEGTPLTPGSYLFLEVEDNGSGMDEATRGKIFDPFFTTKFQGRGLGLSAVLGIIVRHKGALRVASRPGEGTRFTILFPPDGEPLRTRKTEASASLPPVGGTILVVDDEPAVRTTALTTLARSGFDVLLAESGAAALELFRKRSAEISLILLDVTMPAMSGRETFAQIQRIRPEVPVILSSGYNEREAAQSFRGHNLAGFLQKPYTSAQLSDKVSGALRRSNPG